ncbi:hypothetical protein NC652_006666 [Populus alba x Populus x berolinensis]|nr:hypothetical protein NC652_006666 [Populus alba x Populus x berolinensis]
MIPIRHNTRALLWPSLPTSASFTTARPSNPLKHRRSTTSFQSQIQPNHIATDPISSNHNPLDTNLNQPAINRSPLKPINT